MPTVTEGQFRIGRASLYARTWTPAGSIRAKLIFVHGFSEHINRYNDLFPKLADQGIQVFGWDQRGWGRSVSKASQRGQTGPTALVVADMAAFTQHVLPSEVPVFVMGHSMGGGEVLTLASDAAYEELIAQVRGWILESPLVWFSPEEEPSSVKVLACRLAGRLLPKKQMKHAIPPEHHSRFAAVVEAIRNYALCHSTGTLEGLRWLLHRTSALASGNRPGLGAVRSLLFTHGTQDKTCSFEATMKYCQEQTVADKMAKPYQGAYHQLHSDYCRDEFAADVIGWILSRTQPDTPFISPQTWTQYALSESEETYGKIAVAKLM